MNERIRVLAIEADAWYDQNRIHGAPDWAQWEMKFAELIVRECAQFIEDKFDFCGDELVAAEKLKEHFGVE